MEPQTVPAIESLQHGHRYGNVDVSSGGFVHLGDVIDQGTDRYVSHIEAVAERQQQIELRQGLYYDSMDQRKSQLESASSVSPSWIWDTNFSAWSTDRTAAFWVYGKPGSGKSTLMQYLSNSPDLRRRLASLGGSWHICTFFFDFRAGSGIANTPLGMLRSFLLQITSKIKAINDYVRQMHGGDLFGSWRNDTSQLMETLCTALRLAQASFCLLIDGLDEYDGKLVELTRYLTTIQQRCSASGKLKMLLASRPEPMLVRALASLPSLQMQDYNAMTIRNYVHYAVQAMLDTREQKILRPLCKDVERESNGVILWARFVVDELVEQTILGATTAELRKRLESYPKEMEDFYARIIDRITLSGGYARLTVAILLFILEHGEWGFQIDGAFSTYHVMIAWCKMNEVLDNTAVFDATFDETRFRAKVHALLGGLLEFSTTLTNIAYVHKTFRTYLIKSNPFCQENRDIIEPAFPVGRSDIPTLRQQCNILVVYDGNLLLRGNDKLSIDSLLDSSYPCPEYCEMTAVIMQQWQIHLKTGHFTFRLKFFGEALGGLFDLHLTDHFQFLSIVSMLVMALHCWFCRSRTCTEFGFSVLESRKSTIQRLDKSYVQFLLHHGKVGALELALHQGYALNSALPGTQYDKCVRKGLQNREFYPLNHDRSWLGYHNLIEALVPPSEERIPNEAFNAQSPTSFEYESDDSDTDKQIEVLPGIPGRPEDKLRYR